ncbi:hypothetical protein V7127_16405 [Bacillus sp. JJ1773]|uniref:hypothetical protein n=1 Tax=Bacillus sp. JJ1773 TaxID=3122965 RepID=UPI002FFF8859
MNKVQSRVNDLEDRLEKIELKHRPIQDAHLNREKNQEQQRTHNFELTIALLNNKIQFLEEKVIFLEKQNQRELHSQGPTFIVDHLSVENISVEKMEYANNFEQLGIKELSGKLSIGTSYEGKIDPNKLSEKLAKLKEKEKKE